MTEFPPSPPSCELQLTQEASEGEPSIQMLLSRLLCWAERLSLPLRQRRSSTLEVPMTLPFHTPATQARCGLKCFSLLSPITTAPPFDD